MNNYYINVNYTCNSNCRFCAADSPQITHPKELDIFEYQNIFRYSPPPANDSVTLNGGEPTVCKAFLDILSYNSCHNASTILFTNGINLANRTFCNRLLNNSVTMLAIPIYGYDHHTHDYVTQTPGSFNKVTIALDNISKHDRRKNILVELKILLCKSTLNHLPQIFSEIMKFDFDIIQLSGMIPSHTTLNNQEVVTGPELQNAINAFLAYIWPRLGSKTLDLIGIPLCMLSNENLAMYLYRKSIVKNPLSSVHQEFYSYDVNNDLGLIRIDTSFKHSICPKLTCNLLPFCNLNTLVNYRSHLSELLTNVTINQL